MGSYKMCMCFTRKFKINEVQPPLDIREAFAKFTDGGTLMTADQLLDFLIHFQGETCAKFSDAVEIIQQIMSRRHHIAFTRHALTPEDFQSYLFSDDLNSAIRNQVYHDMKAPLSHYFIYTGHNSYLTGNQLSSECSEVPIEKALKRGVRVIELDIWPNSSKDDVHVLHGRTLTSPVALVKCLKSIKEHAFSTSPYPVVITLEDHLSPYLQAKVAEAKCLEEFPSPEALKYRIILSTKPPKEYLERLEGKTYKDKDLFEEDSWGKELPDTKLELPVDYKSDSELSDQIQDEEDIIDSGRKSCQLGAPQYKRLIAIHAKKSKGGLKESLKVDDVSVRRLSLSEQKLEKARAHHGTALVRFTQRNLLRVYPKGTRFNSSNYNPLIGWMHGAQMVAFNMQGYGRALWLMQGMFRSNGDCGYVKKPDILMQSNRLFDPKIKLPVKKTLKVRVYMGDGWRLDFNPTHFDAYSPPDFYTRVGIAGVPRDVKMQKTKIMEDDWTPVWDKEFSFPLTVPELALLRIEVHEYDMSEKDDFGGQTCLRFGS
ncbi:hypothetical protein IFM89_035385 [Coptis chinensis]|uniref:Phosphoinositide phospholipase C n=1 Tax=Coptis chinensis TaxID=261450 RepID=A0A835HHG2_9MAGN|nr:hypothetical protein IFM89_035385 [Coptis chinensis]